VRPCAKAQAKMPPARSPDSKSRRWPPRRVPADRQRLAAAPAAGLRLSKRLSGELLSRGSPLPCFDKTRSSPLPRAARRVRPLPRRIPCRNGRESPAMARLARCHPSHAPSSSSCRLPRTRRRRPSGRWPATASFPGTPSGLKHAGSRAVAAAKAVNRFSP
jgi:hypothetical protein